MKRKSRNIKHFFAIFMTLILVLPQFPNVVSATEMDTSWYSSSGTSFTITTAAQLAGLANLVNAGNDFSGKTITLGNNINLNSEAWTPIGTSTTPFKGTFNGQGYTVQNLSVSGFTCVGLFGYADGSAVIKNVTVTGVASGTSYVGGIVGFTTSEVTVANCTNSAAVNSSGTRTGGVVGHNVGTVSDCTSTGAVISDGARAYTGGIAGYNAGTVSNSYNIGNVSNSNTDAYYTGGIVGSSSGTVSNCHNTGAVSGGASIGGEVGLNDSGIVSNCYNTGTISSGNYTGVTNTGGVVGANSGTVSNSYNIGTVNGGTRIGGVVGRNNLGTVSNCYNIGTVSGGTYNGGVAGGNDATLDNNYYLNATVSAAIGEGSGTATNVSDKTASQFASGEVTYLLNGSISGGTTWYQNIDNGETADSYPVLSSSSGKVYYGTNCAGTAIYSNNSVSVIHVGSTYDSNGFCTRCGNGYQPATLNSGIYEISNAGQLFWFASLINGDTTQEGITAAVPDACAVLTSNIDLSVTTSTHTSIEWTPIGSKTTPFSGTFDGAGYTVSGMSITTASDYMGLFGYVSAGTIKNLTVSGKIDVTGSSLYAGGIVGTVKNGTLSNLTSNVSVTAYDSRKGTFGGVAATIEDGSTMELCINNGQVLASGVLDCVGGLVGYMNSATITDCANYGMVDTSGGTAAASEGIYTGGIVSYINNANANVTNCFSVGTISGVDSSSIVSYTGAIIGRINNNVGSVTNCYYLSSAGSTLAGVGANGSGVTAAPTAKTATEFASGEVAWLLQGDRQTKVWGQDLTNRTTTTDDDLYPVFNDDWDLMVLQISFYYKLGNTVETDPFYIGYTNYAAALASYPTEADATYTYYTYDGGSYTQISTSRSFGDNENVYVEAAYAVVQDLGSNLQSSNTDTSALRGSSYSTTLMGVECYVLPDSITVTSGGTELTAGTDYTYDSTMGEVTISKVMGKIVITADATNISHSYDSGIVTTEPTCTDEGVMTYSCTVCGETRTEAISATGHSYISVVTDPTCTEKGYTTHTCTICGHSYTDNETEATGHSYTSVVTAPTCTEEGYTTHTCSVCGDTYVDSETEATGHSWDEGVITTAAGCTAEGVRTYTCTVCGETKTEAISAIGHTAGEAVTENEVAATCTTDGSYDNVVYCSVCGAELSRDTITVPATGHSYTSVVTDPTCTEKGYTTHTCSTCGYSYTDNETEATGHSYTSVVTDPTCTEKGYTTHTCTTCGYSYTDNETEATGHTHGEAVKENNVEAACTTDGLYDSVVYCTVCGAEISRETITIPATGHNYTSVVTDPTCTEKGYTTHTCATCGHSYTDNETEATGHSWDEGVITTEATCTTEGVRTYTCTVCGEIKTEDILATGHIAGEAVIENEVEATCTTNGSHDSAIYCTVCGAEISRETVVIPATGHNYTSVVTDPTCTEKGYTTHTCMTCGYSYTDNETEATGHSYTSVVTAPTCTEEGYTTHTCSVCGDTYVDSKTEAMGHSWDEGVITTAAGCAAEGVRTYTCTVCGETKTEAISATGHTAGEAVKENEVAAICTTDGSYDSVVYCTVCGAELSRDTVTVPAKGHSYTSVVTDPTCTEKGYTTYTCTICGHSYTDNETEATGHSWDEGVITTETACTAEGVITYTCTVCEETKTVAISATGHTAGEAVIENEVAAICTEDGSYESVVYCTVCGAEISRETITVPAIGHSYTSVVTDPTCTEKGYTTHTCSTCGDTYTDSETEAIGHTYEATEVVASTYTEKGYTVYTCTGCGDSYEADYTDIRIIDGTDENLTTKTVVQELTEVPEGLREIYESVAELIADLESRVLVSQGYTEDNTLVIDVVLQYRINGGEWIDATADNFPNGGITVTLDYPDGTDSSYDFMVVHMFTVSSERLGITAGEVEMPEVTKTDEGLVVTLNGLSPVMISWKEVATEETSISEEETTAIKEETSASEEETTAIEEETSASEEETTAIEEETSASEEETTAIEEETSASEEETTAIEEETSASEEETTVIEEETSASEEETTASEEETSASEEETSASETEATSSENDNSNEAAQTGDAGKLAIWFTVISLIGLTGAQVYRRRKRLS